MFRYLLENVTFPLIAYREGYGGIVGDLRSLEESQFWPLERILELQRERLKKILVHAYEHTGFYKKRFDDSGFNPYSFRHADQLRRIPLLTKEQIRDNIGGLVARNYPPGEIHSSETGGTSEVKMRFYRDNACLSMKEAAIYRFARWAGWNFGDYTGLVWPAHQDFVGHNTVKYRIRNEFYQRHVFFPAALIDDRACGNYVRKLKKKRPTTILAFPTPIYELAKYMAKKGVDDMRLKGIITTGEPLYDHQRKLVSELFHCEVLDSYRSREAGTMAQECEAHEGMHINAESLYLELDGLKQVSGGSGAEAGSVVATDLLNYGMPLIRYSMSDYALMSGRTCSCGRNLPLIDKIVGRDLEVFVTPDGKLVSTIALVIHMINQAPGIIGRMQVIQDAADHLLIKTTRDPSPGREVIDHQRKVIDTLFGTQMRATYEFVDDIPREKSGKYLFAKRLIPISE